MPQQYAATRDVTIANSALPRSLSPLTHVPRVHYDHQGQTRCRARAKGIQILVIITLVPLCNHLQNRIRRADPRVCGHVSTRYVTPSSFKTSPARRPNHFVPVQLHNALIISIFDPSTHMVAALTPPPDVPKGPPRKRRRLLPYQGPDPDEPITLRSSRLKRWAVGIGRRERDRIRNLKPVAMSSKQKPRPEVDEIANERGVRLLQERGGACISRRPEKLCPMSPQNYRAAGLQFSWYPPHVATLCNISRTGSISFVLNMTLDNHLRTRHPLCPSLMKYVLGSPTV